MILRELEAVTSWTSGTLCLQINLSLGFLVGFQAGMVVRELIVDLMAGLSIDATSGLIWVENQVSLGASETIMGKEQFEQWLYDIACVVEALPR